VTPARTGAAPRPSDRPPAPADTRLKPAAEIEPLLTLDGLARVLNASRSTVERMRAAGQLPPPDLYIGTGRRKSPRWRPETIRRLTEGGGA
jgi:hypothetical protein